jgi:hypothetical protein
MFEVQNPPTGKCSNNGRFPMLPNAQIKTNGPEVKVSGHFSNGHGAGNGSESVSGRGLAHRPVADRLALGVDVATGRKRLDPSLGQIAHACRITHAQLRRAIRARTNGNGADNSLSTPAALATALVNMVGRDAAFDTLFTITSSNGG